MPLVFAQDTFRAASFPWRDIMWWSTDALSRCFMPLDSLRPLVLGVRFAHRLWLCAGLCSPDPSLFHRSKWQFLADSAFLHTVQRFLNLSPHLGLFDTCRHLLSYWLLTGLMRQGLFLLGGFVSGSQLPSFSFRLTSAVLVWQDVFGRQLRSLDSVTSFIIWWLLVTLSTSFHYFRVDSALHSAHFIFLRFLVQDRHRRTSIIALSTFVWSLSTAMQARVWDRENWTLLLESMLQGTTTN